jgi:hypothetical protein
MNNKNYSKYEYIRKDSVNDYWNVLSQHLSEETAESHVFEQRTSQTPVNQSAQLGFPKCTVIPLMSVSDSE